MSQGNINLRETDINDKQFRFPLISIITVCFNAEKDIEKTLQTTLEQTDTDYEYIIIDGKSTDRTLDIIKRYRPAFEKKNINVKLVSERDDGIFDAMNKGIQRAQGTWINFMNAGDYFFHSDTLKRIKDYLLNSKADIVYGDCYRYHKFYSYIKVPGTLDLLKQGMAVSHQASFIRSTVQKEHLFSLKYHLAGDHDLFLRLYIRGYNFEYIPELVCVFSLEGVSNSNLIDAYKETYMVLSDNKIVDLRNLSTRIRYISGYIERFFEMMLPTDLKWKLKAVKKKMIDNIKNK